MRRIAFIVVIATVAVFAASAGAQKSAQPGKPSHTEERGWPLDMDGMIRIHNYNGTISVTGWDRDSVAITAVIAGNTGLFGGGGRRGVKSGLESADASSAPVANFIVFVPSRAQLSVRGAATAIDIRNFAGTIDVSTLSGRIRIAGAITEVTAETMDGDIEIEASPNYLRGKTATGRISWNGSSDDVTLSTVSGAIVMPSATLHRARFESISGDLKFTGTVKSGGRVSFDSHGGDVSLAFSKETHAELTVDAPRWNILGAEPTAIRPANRAQIFGVPAGRMYAPAGLLAGVEARSFKGKVTVTQP
jgi:hypothetical protein